MSGYEVHNREVRLQGATGMVATTVRVPCPDGKVALGGGDLNLAGAEDTVVTRTAPIFAVATATATGWEVVARNTTLVATNVKPWVICADMSTR